HDQEAAAVLLPVVEDDGDVGVHDTAGVAGLGAQPVERGLVTDEAWAQHLRGHGPPQQQVAGAPHLAHPADGDAFGELVALAEQMTGPDRHHQSCSSAASTSRAIGAAVVPPEARSPSSPPFSTRTATA